MARVHLLDDELINKIAAGEVVERPASVVKELVENAIDAGSSQIRVSLKDGGRQLIEVSDDGAGMSPVDAVLAIKRHTTSKLRSVDDLFEVGTMGFRGEALASISSVSRFTLQSMSRESSEGVRVHHEDGKTTYGSWQGPFGTTLSIKELFYNVPARKTFLKSSAAEFAVCHEFVQALALALPERGFRLLHNDKEMFSVSPLPVAEGWARGEQALRLRAAAILGEEITSKLTYVQHADKHAKLEGLISPPGLDKASAKHIFTFVNNRWVKDKVLKNGVLRGYHSHILRGKFPIALIYLNVDPSLVDVNVHPAKTELRFQYGSEVQSAVAMAIRDGLRHGAWSGPKGNPAAAVSASYSPKEKPSEVPPIDFDLLLTKTSSAAKSELDSSIATMRAAAIEDSLAATRVAKSAVPPPSSLPSTHKRTTYSYDTPSGDPQRKAAPSPAQDLHTRPLPARQAPYTPPLDVRPVYPAKPLTRSEAKEVQATQKDEIPWDELQFMGAFQKCFLFFEHKDQMLVVDQHAFHERILYERLLKSPESLKRSQPLLMPEVLEFSATEIVDLGEREAEYKELGFDFKKISETEIEVNAVPTLLVNKDIQGIFSSLAKSAHSQQEILHDVLASVACHAAVRAGEDLPAPELKQLLQEAKTVDFYLNCPHGRRVLRWWKASQVAAWFDRL